MSEIEWIITYGDLSTYCNLDGPWNDAPGWNAQVIAIPDELVGRRLHSRRDYYIKVVNDILGVDLGGLIDQLANNPSPVKVGRTLPHRQWLEVYDFAWSDPRLPRKSARAQGEEHKP